MAAIHSDEICKIADRETQTKVNPVVVEERKPENGKTWKIQIWSVTVKRADGDTKGQPFRIRGGDLSKYIVSSKSGTPDPNSYVPIKQGPRDPADLKPGQEDYGPSIEIVLNPATSFGRAVEYRNSKFEKAYETLKAQPAHAKTNMCDFILKNYGTDPMVPADKRGKPRPQPIIRCNLDFEKFPANHKVKELQGRPKTEVYDYDTMRVVDGKLKMDLATVDGVDDKGNPIRVALDEKNAHQFLTYDSHIIDFDLDTSCDKKSKSGYSIEKTLTRLVVKKRAVVRRDNSEMTVDAAALEAAKELAAVKQSSPPPAKPPAATPPVLVSTQADPPKQVEKPADPVPAPGTAEVSADVLAAFVSGLSTK